MLWLKCRTRISHQLSRRCYSHLAYEVICNGKHAKTNENKKNLILMHGLMGCKMNWRSFAKRISNTRPEYQIILLDLRGHGKSEPSKPPHNLSNCANDLKHLFDDIRIQPDVICGHSFGGKAALAYINKMHNEGMDDLPNVWVFDAPPGSEENDYKNLIGHFQGIKYIIPVLQDIQTPIKSKRKLIEYLATKGIGENLGAWISTNLTQEDKSSGYTWKFDLTPLGMLYESFLSTDYWPLLESPTLNTEVNFVRAEYNKIWCKNNIIKSFEELESQNSGSKSVKLYLLPESDHWVHVDNSDGLFDIFMANLK